MSMRKGDIKFDFDDVLLTPKEHTSIVSRYSGINPYYEKKLPIITAPMDTVASYDNIIEFNENKIIVAIPRTETYKQYLEEIMYHSIEEMTFISFNLKSFRELYLEGDCHKPKPIYPLLDVANGHMEMVMDYVTVAKKRFPHIKIMVGNIANPKAYEWYARSKAVDFVRIGIGNGNACLTTKQTSVGYPKASLIYECNQIKKLLDMEIGEPLPKIVADGGMKDYSDIIKSLALGADYVMVGSIFNKALESSGDNYLYKWKISRTLATKLYNKGFPIKKRFYGMSTKVAQKKMGRTILKTSEGIERYNRVEYTLAGWVENFEHYLRSAMSYCGATNLNEFIGKADFEFITENAFNRFNK